MAKTYPLFVSHAWAYTNAYRHLCTFLDGYRDFDYSIHHVPYDDPVLSGGSEKDLSEAIRKHMAPAAVVILPAGRFRTHGKWLQAEIEVAKKRFSPAKPVLGVLEYETLEVAKVVRSGCTRIVEFGAEAIVSAIIALAR